MRFTCVGLFCIGLIFALLASANGSCPGDVTNTHTGYVMPGPTFPPFFDITLWNGPNGVTNSVDLQAIILYLNYESWSISPVDPRALAADVTATHTGYVPPSPPEFIADFDMALWDGPDGKIDSIDLQALILLLNQYPGFLYNCP